MKIVSLIKVMIVGLTFDCDKNIGHIASEDYIDVWLWRWC